MDGLTLPAICKETGEGRPRIERIVAQYAHELPPASRFGIVRVWPREVLDRIRDILAREERCGSGSGR